MKRREQQRTANTRNFKKKLDFNAVSMLADHISWEESLGNIDLGQFNKQMETEAETQNTSSSELK